VPEPGGNPSFELSRPPLFSLSRRERVGVRDCLLRLRRRSRKNSLSLRERGGVRDLA